MLFEQVRTLADTKCKYHTQEYLSGQYLHLNLSAWLMNGSNSTIITLK